MTLRSGLTWAVGAALVALAITATVDALWSSSPRAADLSGDVSGTSAGRGSGSPREPVDALPPCAAQNLALSIDVLGGSPFIALRHNWGKPCHLARLPVELTVRDRAGRPVRRVGSEASVSGDFPRAFVRLIGITYVPTCKQRGPFVAFVTVGPAYSARRRLPPVGCFWGP